MLRRLLQRKHPLPGTAEYQQHVDEEIEHYGAMFREGEGRERLQQPVPPSWHECERRAAMRIHAKTGAFLNGHVASRLNARVGTRFLSLGSGPGGMEIEYAKASPRSHFVCMDINPGLLDLGRERASTLGLDMEFVTADLNVVELPPVSFDVVYCAASLHHVMALEHVAEQIVRTLKPNGVLITVDVVTPNGYLMWPETRKIVHAIWETLPDRLRVNHTAYGEPRLDEKLFEADQSEHGMECARSGEILQVLDQAFAAEAFVPYFSISRRLLDTMYGPNYRLEDPFDRAVFDWIWSLDCHYIDSGTLKPETFFGIYAPRRRRSWRSAWDERVATIAGAEATPPPALAHKPFVRGTCNVCGQRTRFFHDDPSLHRESLACEHCRATSRYRSIARGVLRAIAERTGVDAPSIAELPLSVPGTTFAVYDMQPPFYEESRAYPLPDLLAARHWISLTLSSHRPDMPPGSPIDDRIVNQNPERLTFEDRRFDLVITSDALAHVRHADHLHAEIARVLKPDGVHVFTVPRDHRGRLQTVDGGPAQDARVVDPAHPASNPPAGPNGDDRGDGTALRAELEAIGFEVDSIVDDAAAGILDAESFYCTLRHPPTRSSAAGTAVDGSGRYPSGHFYSPIIDVREVERLAGRIWPPQPPALAGIDFDEAGQRELLEQVFPRYIGDYDYPDTLPAGAPSSQFHDANPAFGWLDSRALFVFLRHWQPARVIEVGAGYSTLLMADVNRRFLGGRTHVAAIEPFPPAFLTEGIEGLSELIVSRVQDVPLSRFDDLQAGDILFIDSSHVSKTGSDVNHLYFEVLPRLRPGVRIHVHDIFLPFDYPREWVLEQGIYWNEQYLLRAMLTFTRGFRVVFGSAFVNARWHALLTQALNGRPCDGASFWLERVER